MLLGLSLIRLAFAVRALRVSRPKTLPELLFGDCSGGGSGLFVDSRGGSH